MFDPMLGEKRNRAQISRFIGHQVLVVRVRFWIVFGPMLGDSGTGLKYIYLSETGRSLLLSMLDNCRVLVASPFFRVLSVESFLRVLFVESLARILLSTPVWNPLSDPIVGRRNITKMHIFMGRCYLLCVRCWIIVESFLRVLF